ncbi:hypothetical protein CAPTEDRAFT_206901 [Capitella teleta]|uniref:Uncharacterized protein n=1 Tax=Capitella teleta TaxID=283909 RepID=R7UGP2_CAPTE|nr:hypothetical protein CAPTEDRAFT_206901 [Capitella teleta]|eukprot:ELU05273.1 hypothetical protein CAPTEDRAFT_206901 [Capitella teleta]
MLCTISSSAIPFHPNFHGHISLTPLMKLTRLITAMLLKDAFPTLIILMPPHLKINLSRQIAEQNSGSDFGDSEVAHYQEKVDVGNFTKHDHTYATTPALLQHQLKTARERIQHLEHEACNAKLREKRAKLTAQRTKAAEAHK